MKNLLLTIFLLLIIAGSLIGDWSRVKLFGTGYELKDPNGEHSYLVNSVDDLVVPQYVVDLEVLGDYILALRVVAVSYECRSDENKIFIFTHYSGVQKVAVVNYKENVIVNYGINEFLIWLQSLNLSHSLNITKSYYSNDKAFQKIKRQCAEME